MDVYAFLSFMHLEMTPVATSLQVSAGHLCIRYAAVKVSFKYTLPSPPPSLSLYIYVYIYIIKIYLCVSVH